MDPSSRYVEVDQPFITGAATRQQAAGVFGDAWVTRLHDLVGVDAGTAELYADARVHWLLERPELALEPGRTTILDLGTLEGGHAHGFAGGGARVVGVEAHVAAWLRALALNEMRDAGDGVLRPRMVLGEAGAYLKAAAAVGAAADLVNASGLLYHLTDPFDFLAAARAVSPLIFVWTHYFDADWFAEHAPDHLDRFGPPTVAPGPDGVELPARRHGYLERRSTTSFYGGSERHSLWLTHEGLQSAIRAAGYPELTPVFHNLEHPNGPSIGYLGHDPDGTVGDTDALWAEPWQDAADPELRGDAATHNFVVLTGRAEAPPTPPPPPPPSLTTRVLDRAIREVRARRG